MTQRDSPDDRPLTRREMRERLQHEGQQEPASGEEAVTTWPADALSEDRAPRGAQSNAGPAARGSESDRPRTGAIAAQSSSERSAPERGTSAVAAQSSPDGPPSERETPAAAAGSSSGSETGSPSSPSLESLLTPPEGTPRPKKRRGGGIAIILIIVALIAALVVGGFWAVKTYGGPIAEFFGAESEPVDYEEGIATGEALIMIEPGDTGWEVSQALHEADVTLTESVFYDMLVGMQKNPEFQPGRYQLQQKMTAANALATLEEPDSRLPGVAFPEGYTVEQIVPVIASGLEISEDDVRTALEDPSDYGVDADSLEGWLFPRAYDYTPEDDVSTVIQGMVDRTHGALDESGVPDDEVHRVLTIASIIEREARAEDDFYRVSRVIQNRLDDGMRLQMDSTAQYGYGEMHEGDVFSSAEALEDENPWNTYVHTGLPTGPISNPGALAIDAAMNPADGDWLYFATVNLSTGETKFAATLEGHEQNVAELQQWCADNPDATGCG